MVELIRGLHNLRPGHLGCVATIGSFDGVHRGHQAIIERVKQQAQTLGVPSLVMFFEPQPHEFFSREKAPARLMRLREKVEALSALGVERILIVPFNERLRKLSAAEFVDKVLVKGLGVRFLVVGDDFRFGCDRQGDFAFLQQAGAAHNFQVQDTATLVEAGERVSSTRIRQQLEIGDLNAAQHLLSRPYSISGRVMQGNQLGRQLGFPTANIHLQRYRSPLAGVFAVEAEIKEVKVSGVANVGVRPTVDGIPKPILEVHLFNFNDDIYSEHIRVSFCKKLRDEKKFSSLDELKDAIAKDIETAQHYFKN